MFISRREYCWSTNGWLSGVSLDMHAMRRRLLTLQLVNEGDVHGTRITYQNHQIAISTGPECASLLSRCLHSSWN